ncbi:membrane protein [Beggiatoa sp. PS]|nr:membrane protein [Beggiatoa sp. PS]
MLTLIVTYGSIIAFGESVDCQQLSGEQQSVSNQPQILGINKVLCKIVSSTTEVSLILMIMVFLYSVFDAAIQQNKKGTEKADKRPKLLISILISSLSVSAIPTGISLIISAFNKDFISYMSGVEIYIAFAGFSIISVGYLSSRHEEEEIQKELIGTPAKLNDVFEDSK